MENCLSKSQKICSNESKKPSKFKSFKSKSLNINISTNINDRYTDFYSKNKNISKIRIISKTINIEDNLKNSYSYKKKNNGLLKPKISSSIMTKRNKSNKNLISNFDFEKFDMHQIEYNLDKKLSKNTKFSDFSSQPFLSRMESDIKYRQTKEERRKNLLNEYKPKEKEEDRIKCFNRLISDSNKRNKIKVNIRRQNEFFNPGITPKKISKKKWDMIYENRFYNYQEKIDNNLREKIIENEKMIKQKEEEIIEQINSNVKKVNKKDLEKIINRLYFDSKIKKINKKLDNILSNDKDKANGMKKEEKIDEDQKNINNNIDNLELSRGQKQHHTIKSTKIREKKNSYFGSVIIKTSTFEQGKTNSLIKFIQNIGKSENKCEKRHTIQCAEKEIKEIENENVNMSILNQSKTINNINNNNNKNIKKNKSDKFQNLKSIGNIWANETHIKKSKSLKRILVNDFNTQNMKFNINSNYKNKNNNNEKKIKKLDNGLDIINSEYYQNIDAEENIPDEKINDINLNLFVINDLKNSINRKNKLMEKRYFSSSRKKKNYKNIYRKNNGNNKNVKIMNNINVKEKKNIKGNININNNKRFIDELSAMKIIEDIFLNKIKEK